MIHVCPLSKVDATVSTAGAERLISLLAAGTAMTRPAAIAEHNHLFLSLHDIAEPREGMTPPGETHVRTLLDFAGQLGPRAAAGHQLLCRHQPLDRLGLHHRGGAGAEA